MKKGERERKREIRVNFYISKAYTNLDMSVRNHLAPPQTGHAAFSNWVPPGHKKKREQNRKRPLQRELSLLTHTHKPVLSLAQYTSCRVNKELAC